MTSLNKEIVTLDVGPNLVDCVGFIPQKCMLVREEDEQDFTYLYDAIEGFDYESGYNYKLRLWLAPRCAIRKPRSKNPPADASSIQWTLVEQLVIALPLPRRSAKALTTNGLLQMDNAPLQLTP
ncbi:MAG: DUF4377 domain-containing protein [Hormoscilla sp. GM7CHS1pb]|nr:DUF4377 domain-containing protein [Hormoscilla sp. GM7CHS1pb]